MERHLTGPWARLVRGKAEVLELVGRRSAEVRERRPPMGGWSLVDVVEHLVLVEQGLNSALAKAPNPARPRVVRWDQGFRFLVMRVVLKVGVRVKAPVVEVLPTRELPWHALLSRWEEHRRGLEEWLLSADPAILGDARFKHPIVGWLTVPQALTFAADHLEHHLAQIGRIGRVIG